MFVIILYVYGFVNEEAAMKREKKIFVAFILNLSFCIFEFIGGSLTGSTAIISDAVHDLGDAVSIGISFLLERKGSKASDEKIKERYSHIGGIFTSVVLIVGSVAAALNAVHRLFNPIEPDYDGMLIFAFVGVLVNSAAAFVTHGGENINLKAVNLHMLEDVLGWVAVLAGALVMKLTGFGYIDPLMSVGVSVFIMISAVKNISGHGHSGCSHGHHH
jgi:cobalt-zinc-cadmium efflux system protein